VLEGFDNTPQKVSGSEQRPAADWHMITRDGTARPMAISQISSLVRDATDSVRIRKSIGRPTMAGSNQKFTILHMSIFQSGNLNSAAEVITLFGTGLPLVFSARELALRVDHHEVRMPGQALLGTAQRAQRLRVFRSCPHHVKSPLLVVANARQF